MALPILAVLLSDHPPRAPLVEKMQGAMDRESDCAGKFNGGACRKIYVRGDYEIEKFEEVNDNLETISERAFRLAVLNMPAMQLVMYSTILAILWFGGKQIRIGSMKVGELTGFLSYVLQVLNSLMMISNVFMMLPRSWLQDAVFWRSSMKSRRSKDHGSKEKKVTERSVTFDHVWFKYRKAKEYVLSDVSFEIPAGKTVGIVGQTGAAKTTLVQLIPRLYEATKGIVKVDGVPVEEYSLAHLRDAVAMVLQKNTVYRKSAGKSSLGNPEASDENS